MTQGTPTPDITRQLAYALEGALRTLKEAEAMVRNEISACELSSRSSNAWPDMLDGRVSGGGIIDEIESIEDALSAYRESLKGEGKPCMNAYDQDGELIASRRPIRKEQQ